MLTSAVVTALGSLVAVAVPAAKQYVGPNAGDDRDEQPLAVLLADDGDPASDAIATEERDPASMGGGSHWRGVVPCALISFSGDTDLPSRLAEMDAALAAIAVRLAADPTLGGVVLHAWFAGSAATALQTEDGANALAQFTITYLGQTAY